jgi:hypothetical protein
LFKVPSNRRRIGQHNVAIHQDRNLALARHSEDCDLADPRRDINRPVAEPFGL